LVYGISKLALEPEPNSEPKSALEGRITQP
jgi:hypothetical protein